VAETFACLFSVWVPWSCLLPPAKG